MKKIFFGILIGILCVYLGYEAVEKTGNSSFCISCHVMKPMQQAYLNDAHSGKNSLGIKAECTDCHLPHDNMFNYLFTKAVDGGRDLIYTAIGKDEKVNWIKNLDRKNKFVYDSGCLKCHQNVLSFKSSNTKQNDMHNRYLNQNNLDNKLNCISCHTHVGHFGMRGELNKFDPKKYPLNK